MKQQQSPDTGLTTETYDGAGNLKTRTDARGITVIDSYDALNRLTTVDYPDDSLDVGYSNDEGENGIGRLTGMTDASGSTVYGYDARGNLTSVSHTVLGQVYLTQYGYNSADRRIRVTYPSGRVVDTPRDSAGRISAVSTTYAGQTQTLASSLVYDPFGPLTGYTYGNGVSRSVGYDLDGRIEALESDPVQSLDYTYNVLDQLTDLTDLSLTALDQSFGYDVLDRLTSASGDYGSQGFSYDGVGDRLTLTEAAGIDSYAYSAGSHRLESITGPNAQTRGYDAVGNTTVLSAYDLDYGENNRLSAARLGGTPLAEYTYDGKGERVIKTEGPQHTVYHYDLQGRLIAETDAEGQTLREYIYLLGEPLAVVLPVPSASQCVGTDPVISGEVVGAGQTYYCQASGSITADEDGLQINTGGDAILAAPLTVLRSGLRIVLGGAIAVGPEATAPTTGALYFIHPDHLGTPRLVSDANQTVVWRWDSSPFGESAPDEDPDGDGQPLVLNLRFPGQYFDQETGLSYNYFRDYDSGTGRYVESDPVGLDGGLDTYSYVGENPIVRLDLRGLAWYCTCRETSKSGGVYTPDHYAKNCRYTCECNCKDDWFPFFKTTVFFASPTRRFSTESWDRGSMICHGQGYDPSTRTPTFSEFSVDSEYRDEYPDVYDVLNGRLRCGGDDCPENR